MLKGDEAALIAGAVAGWSHSEIASAAGVSVSTVQRRLRDADIVAAVQEGRTQQRREAVGRLNEGVCVAVKQLTRLLSDDDPRVVLRAIGLILSNAHRYTTAVEFDERLTFVEALRLGGERS